VGTQGRLIAYLNAQRGKRFELGVHDCLTFTNGAWRAMHGSGYADDVMGQYASLGRKDFAKWMWEKYNTTDLRNALTSKLTPVDGFPPKGALVISSMARPYFTRYALGIACGVTAVFLGGEDMIYISVNEVEGAWL